MFLVFATVTIDYQLPNHAKKTLGTWFWAWHNCLHYYIPFKLVTVLYFIDFNKESLSSSIQLIDVMWEYSHIIWLATQQFI